MIPNCALEMGNAHLEMQWIPLTTEPRRPELSKQSRHCDGQSFLRGFSEQRVQIQDKRKKPQWGPGWFDTETSFIFQHERITREATEENGKSKITPTECLVSEHRASWEESTVPFVGSWLRGQQQGDRYQQIMNRGCRRPGTVWF